MGITASTALRAHHAGIVNVRDVSEVTKKDAELIYLYLYYYPSKADQLDWPLNLIHFDSAVNHGVGGAGKLLQRTLNEINNYAVVVDGAVGPITLEAYDYAFTVATITEIAQKYIKKRREYYHAIVRRRPNQQKFLNGWMNRLRWLRKECGLDDRVA
jgi:lysozyme family protein